MRYADLTLRLPDWVAGLLPSGDAVYEGVEDRMRLAIELSRRNVECGTGGPFGAAVFERDTGRLLGVGVNRVVPAGCSIAHAEMLALALAQRAAGTCDLGAEGVGPCELVSSTAPCAMCLGAVPWSGVRRLVCGAREEDARRVGFDEGDRPADWATKLGSRGIVVVQDVLRDEARAVLEAYRDSGGLTYNGGGG